MQPLGHRYQKMKAKVQSYFRAIAILNLLDNGEVEKPRQEKAVPILLHLTDEEKSEREAKERMAKEMDKKRKQIIYNHTPLSNPSPSTIMKIASMYQESCLMKEFPKDVVGREIIVASEVSALLKKIADSSDDPDLRESISSMIRSLYEEEKMRHLSVVAKLPTSIPRLLSDQEYADLFLDIGKPAVPHLIEALNDFKIGNIAALALGTMKDRSVVPELMELISSDDFFVAARAAKVVAMTGVDEAQFEQLISMAWQNNSSAMEALGLIGNRQAIQVLLELLQDTGSNTGSSVAVRVLVDLKIFSAVPVMVERFIYSRHDDSDLRMFLRNCETGAEIDEFTTQLTEAYYKLSKKKDIPIESKIRLAWLRMDAAKKKNLLAKDKGVLLDDKPKPPLKGRIYRALNTEHRTVRRSLNA